MKELLILRHAKSSWADREIDDHEIDDHDRPLNARGRRDAPRIGRLIRRESIVPDRVFSSTALRAETTAEQVALAGGFEGRLRTSSDLYLAPPATYLELLATLGKTEDRVMVVGHNPGIEELVLLLTRRGERMSTAALALVGLPIHNWRDVLSVTRGDLINLWRPADLPEDS